MTEHGELNLREWSAPETRTPDEVRDGCVDARGADWSNRKLGSLDLKGAKLCRCDIRGCDLSRCDLEGADLRLAIYDHRTSVPESFNLKTSGAVGPGAKLNGAYLNNTDLRGMDLRGAVFLGSYLSGTDLSGAVLDGVSFSGSDLRQAILRGAMCRGTRFGTCEMDFTDLRGADLEGASLETMESIKGADFSLCSGLDDKIETLLKRSVEELDCWNPFTRSTTRMSLESLRSKTEA